MHSRYRTPGDGSTILTVKIYRLAQNIGVCIIHIPQLASSRIRMYSVYTVGPTFNLSLRIIQLFTLIGRFELCSRVQNNITIFQSEPMVEKITKRTFAFTLT